MSAGEQVAAAFQSNRKALTGYLTRLVVREEIAEELVQQAAVRALEQESLPEDAAELRAWFFRVATNLALDHLRKHSTWREGVLGETRGRAEADAGFVASSRLMAGSPELKTIAKDHLAVCFACTLRNLRSEESAALLLKEVYDFTVDEVARVMGASFGQAKAWIQSARAQLKAKYDVSCALVAQQGVCFQCVELDRFFRADEGDPLAGSQRDVDARLSIVRERRDAPLGPWHRQMMRLVEEVLDEGTE
ncbi:MAG: RNA polymerase sigma factor [Polyangiaceae bacterium]|nr:RNA polymerase sigma factor [Polyangiaceae bacterium]MCL4756114.1 RNA polymerase sigma factor [Myxococcales bacterium]